MKTIILAFIFLAIIFSVLHHQEVSAEKTYSIKEYGFSIKIPDNWIVFEFSTPDKIKQDLQKNSPTSKSSEVSPYGGKYLIVFLDEKQSSGIIMFTHDGSHSTNEHAHHLFFSHWGENNMIIHKGFLGNDWKKISSSDENVNGLYAVKTLIKTTDPQGKTDQFSAYTFSTKDVGITIFGTQSDIEKVLHSLRIENAVKWNSEESNREIRFLETPESSVKSGNLVITPILDSNDPLSKTDGASYLAIDKDDNLYVVQHSSGFIKTFDKTGKPQLSMAQYYVQPLNYVFDPNTVYQYAVAIDSQSNLYLSGRAVEKYNREGKLVSSYPQTKSDLFFSLMAVDKYDNIYATTDICCGISKIVKYDTNGKILFTIDMNEIPQFQVRILDISSDKEGNLFVLDNLGQIFKFNKDGKLTGNFRKVDDKIAKQIEGLNYGGDISNYAFMESVVPLLGIRLNAIATDSKGDLYALDKCSDNLLKYDSNGNLIFKLDLSGYFYKNICTSEGDLVVDSQGNIFIIKDEEKRSFGVIKIPYTVNEEKSKGSGEQIIEGLKNLFGDKKEEKSMTIPPWIKNNAKWWKEGSITDSDFVKGIQFMVKEKIITIPETAKSAGGSSGEIPSWIKNNAGWWAEGIISDDDFVKGIQYLVEHGIIRV